MHNHELIPMSRARLIGEIQPVCFRFRLSFFVACFFLSITVPVCLFLFVGVILFCVHISFVGCEFCYWYQCAAVSYTESLSSKMTCCVLNWTLNSTCLEFLWLLKMHLFAGCRIPYKLTFALHFYNALQSLRRFVVSAETSSAVQHQRHSDNIRSGVWRQRHWLWSLYHLRSRH